MTTGFFSIFLILGVLTLILGSLVLYKVRTYFSKGKDDESLLEIAKNTAYGTISEIQYEGEASDDEQAA